MVMQNNSSLIFNAKERQNYDSGSDNSDSIICIISLA